jgi:hypothetical protein
MAPNIVSLEPKNNDTNEDQRKRADMIAKHKLSIYRLTLVFVGDCTYKPNVQGIIWFIGSVFDKLHKDVKAMLSYYQGQVSQAPTQFLGLRCNIKIDDYDSARANEDDCKGVNAGAFHIVLANQIGLKNKSFIADVTRDFQVWNHPISGFTSTIQSKPGVSATAAPGTVRELQVQTTMLRQ